MFGQLFLKCPGVWHRLHLRVVLVLPLVEPRLEPLPLPLLFPKCSPKQKYFFTYIYYYYFTASRWIHRRVGGRGNLRTYSEEASFPLRHFVPLFSSNFRGIACWGAQLNVVLRYQSEKNKNIQYLISSRGNDNLKLN